jgi:FkbM family methyltransferase
MRILNAIRKNKIVNGLIRNVLKNSLKLSNSIHSFLIGRWHTSGILDCNFDRYKFKYYNACDDGLPNFFYYNLPYQEKANLNLFITLSGKSKTIADIGANTGLYSLLASIVNPESEIFAFEPHAANADRMKLNLKLNSANNVRVHQVAIGEKDGEIEFAIPKNKSITDVSSVDINFSSHFYPKLSWEYQAVKIKSMDNFARENNVCFNLIKCDVESFEMSVFKGTERILEEDKPTILFECFLDDERKLFFNNLLSKYNYYSYVVLEEGVVYTPEGLVNSYRSNYLITPVKPTKTFISFTEPEDLCAGLLLYPQGK